jgi:AcrR family transcriptional regulator
MESKATCERIIDSAERLFSKHGFSDASLRQITEDAGVNLAAVNYHFGSKEDLYKEVLLRRIRPLNEERLALLANAEQLAGDQSVPLHAILDSFIRPLLRRATDDKTGGMPFLQLICRDLSDPRPFLFELLAGEFDPLVARYTRSFTQALPHLSMSELFWRMQFTIGGMLYAAVRHRDFERASGGLCQGADLDGCIGRLINFCAAGMMSPESPASSNIAFMPNEAIQSTI